jgi:hypothetical protein
MATTSQAQRALDIHQSSDGEEHVKRKVREAHHRAPLRPTVARTRRNFITALSKDATIQTRKQTNKREKKPKLFGKSWKQRQGLFLRDGRLFSSFVWRKKAGLQTIKKYINTIFTYDGRARLQHRILPSRLRTNKSVL